MEKHELRIGNTVLFDSKQDNIFSLGERMAAGLKHSHWHYERLHPIPLTPDILEKCGFDKGGKIKLTNTKFLAWSYGKEFWLENEDGGEMYEFENITSLHQLQNLYFALTGSELTFTPNPTP